MDERNKHILVSKIVIRIENKKNEYVGWLKNCNLSYYDLSKHLKINNVEICAPLFLEIYTENTTYKFVSKNIDFITFYVLEKNGKKIAEKLKLDEMKEKVFDILKGKLIER